MRLLPEPGGDGLRMVGAEVPTRMERERPAGPSKTRTGSRSRPWHLAPGTWHLERIEGCRSNPAEGKQLRGPQRSSEALLRGATSKSRPALLPSWLAFVGWGSRGGRRADRGVRARTCPNRSLVSDPVAAGLTRSAADR